MPRIAFRAKRPMNYEIFRPIHERIVDDPRLDVVLFGKQYGRSNAALFDEVGALPAKRRPNWMAKFCRPDVLVSADFQLATKHARRNVQIFHGVSMKNYFLSKHIHAYDTVFAIGPYMVRRYVEKGFFEEGDPRLRPVGLPKTDRLGNGALDRAATLEGLGLDPSQPTVLYAPTFGELSSLDAYGEAVFDALARWGGNVVVKLHDNAYDPRLARADWRALLDELSGPRFVAPAVSDVVPLLHAADLLVTDISSVAYEFLHTDRPLVFMTFESQLDNKWKGRADLDTWGRDLGVMLTGAEALPATLDAELADPGRLSERRRAARDDLYFHPGRATDAAVRELYEVLDLTPPA